MSDGAKRRVHAAIQALLDPGEIAVCWTLTIDVVGPDGTRYLAHRAGGGVDGTDLPMQWTVIGMARSTLLTAEQQIIDCTRGTTDDDEEDPE